MIYLFIEPEVAGGLGPETVIDNSVHTPIVSKLHYQFDGWLGDDILESFPCYIVTDTLKKGLEESDLSGFAFSEVLVTTSSTFEELHPGTELPAFHWLKVTGIDTNDFWIASDHRLVASVKAIEILRSYNIDNADFEELT